MDSVIPINAAHVLQALKNGGDMRWVNTYMLVETDQMAQAADMAYSILSEHNGQNLSMESIAGLTDDDVSDVMEGNISVHNQPLKIRLKYLIALLIVSMGDHEYDDDRLPDSVFRLYKFLVDKGIYLFAYDVANELGDRSSTEESFAEAERYYLLAINNAEHKDALVDGLMSYSLLLGNPNGGNHNEERELIVLEQAAGQGCLSAMWAASITYMRKIEEDPGAVTLARSYLEGFLNQFESNEPLLDFDEGVDLADMLSTVRLSLASLHLDELIDNPDIDYAMALIELDKRACDKSKMTREEKEDFFINDLSWMERPDEEGFTHNWAYVLEALDLDILYSEQIDDNWGVISIALDEDIDGDEDIDSINMAVVDTPIYQDSEGTLRDGFSEIIKQLEQDFDFPFLITSSFAIAKEEGGKFYTPILLVTENDHRMISLYPGMGWEGLSEMVYNHKPFMDDNSYSTSIDIAAAINQLGCGKSLSDQLDNLPCAILQSGWLFPFLEEYMEYNNKPMTE